jgi:ATP-binding cassette subfamily B (MDR/TAP) protein 1
MEHSKKGFLLVNKGVSLSVTQCPATEKEKHVKAAIPYASAIGSIMYAMLSSRPDVALALSMTSRFKDNLGIPHWTVVKNVIKYLRNTKDMVLFYGGCEEELSVKGYVDASFDTDPYDSKSQTGYVFLVNGGAVSWRRSKQSLVAQSTMESEYMAAAEATDEAVWLEKFIIELGVFPNMCYPICCGFVNRSTIWVGVWQFVEGGEHSGAIRDGGSTSLPSFKSRNGGETLPAAIIHYMATSARLQ